nr:MAG TPA: hypothetical protein [Caudoviricetes sp.]
MHITRFEGKLICLYTYSGVFFFLSTGNDPFDN